MTKDEIIRMAREAAAKRGHTFREVPQVETVEFLEAFFLMASEAEREECAKLCEKIGDQDCGNHAWDATYAIRARSNT